ATKVLMDMGWNGGNYEMNIMINNSLQFGLSDEFTGETLKDFIGRYIRLGLITSMDNADEVLKLAWTPIL
ncbi:MAG: ABC transporter substrate-binding protein, partial [Clostridia bacterium]|nr:ABC transporter substrate-binding protein [Clostridia bacterium]